MSDFDDIDRYADEYTPEHSGWLPGPEALPPGGYDFEITKAELTQTAKERKSLFKMSLRVVGGPQAGTEVQRVTFFDRPEDLRYLGGDMVTLGLDAVDWGKRGKPWSAELIAACPRLAGVRFRGAKSESKGTKQTFHRIHVNARIASGPAAAPPPSRPFDEFAPSSTPPLPAADAATSDIDW